MIKIDKETHIPTDRELREGTVEPIMGLDDLKTPVELELSQPTDIAGREVTHVTVHPPTTEQVKRMQSNANTGKAIELFVVACIQDFSPDDTNQFLPRDYNRIQQIALNFM